MRTVFRSTLVGGMLALGTVHSLAKDELTIYTVQAGDTLSQIAQTQLSNPEAWRQLQRLNKVVDPNRLAPGSKLKLPLGLSRAQPGEAQVLWVQGDTRVKRHKSGHFVALAVGESLTSGDVLETGAESSLTLRFADKSRMMVSPNSRLQLSKLTFDAKTGGAGVQADLDTGGVASSVQPQKGGARYEVRTPALSLAVRGTEFTVMLDGRTGITRSTVTEGMVLASNQYGTTHVPSGFGTQAEMGRAPGKPSALLPAPRITPAQQTLVHLPARFDWSPLEGAGLYRVELFEGEERERLAYAGSTDVARSNWRLLGNGNYQLRVRGIDRNGLDGLDARLDFQVQAYPEAPLVATPGDQSEIKEEKVRFRWARNPAAEYYRFQVSQSTDFSKPVMQVKYLTAKSSGMTLPLPSGQYYWRVAAGNKRDGLGPFGPVQAFRVLAQDGVTAAPDQGFLLRWQSTSPTERYQVEAARDPAFKDIIQSGESTAAELRLQGNQMAYIRIKRINQDGFPGDFEAVQAFDPAFN